MKPPLYLHCLTFCLFGTSFIQAQTTFEWTGGVDGTGTETFVTTGFGNWSPTLSSGDIATGTANIFSFATRTNGSNSAVIGNGNVLTLGGSPRVGLISFSNTSGQFPPVLTFASNPSGTTTARVFTFEQPDTTVISLSQNVTTTVKIGFDDLIRGRLGIRLPNSGINTFHVADAAATLDLSGLSDNVTSRGAIHGGEITQTLAHAKIRKTGAGTLDLRTSDNQGNRVLGTIVEGGTIVISSPLQLGWPPLSVLDDHIKINGGKIRVETSTIGWSSARGVQVGSNIGTIEASTGSDFSIAGIIADYSGEAGALVKTGPGNLTLSGTNTFTGGFSISAGSVSMANTLPLGSNVAPNLSAVIINGGTLRFTGPTPSISFSAANRGYNVGSSIGSVDVADELRTIAFSGPVADAAGQSGALLKTGPGTLALEVPSTFTGGLTINQGTLSVAFADRLGSAAAVNTNAVIINGSTIRFTGTDAATSGANRGIRVGDAPATIEVTDPAKLVTINGTIRNISGQNGTLIKTGPGTLVLDSGTNSYAGTTTVAAGTLLLNLDAAIVSPVTVSSGATLGGLGTVTSGATVSGFLSPGIPATATPGTLQIGTTLTLNTGSTTTFEILDAATADKITGPTAATFGGTVAIALLNSFEPAIGDSFDLLDASGPVVLGPNFAFSLPTLATGKVWNTSAFATTGVISVATSAPVSEYDTWAAFYTLTGNDALRGSNPDKDGFTNFEEYSFGTNPTTPTGSLIGISQAAPIVTVTYIARNTGLSYAVKSTTTFASWSNATGITELTGVNQTGVPAGYTRKQFTSPIGSRQFFRVECTQP